MTTINPGPSKASLLELLVVLESGSRPKGGVKGIQSGVPSLGGEHLTKLGGFDFSKIRFVPEAFANEMRRGLIRKGDILVVKDGATTGKVSLVREDFPYERAVVNEHVFIVRPKPEHDPRYLFYYLLSNRGQQEILSDFRGAAQGGISQGFATKVSIPVVDRPTQEGIVAELETQLTRLDASVTSLKCVQTNLKRYRASILRAACEGRLVPTEAELARGERRGYESGSDLLGRILTARRDQWSGRGKYKEAAPAKEGALETLPEGWARASVEQIATKVVDGVHKKPNYVPAGIPFVTVRNLTAGSGISFAKLNYISPEDHKDFIKRANPEKGDILISKDGTLGVVRAVKTDVEFSIFVSVAMVKPVLREMSSYLEAALSAPQVQRQMVPKGSGLQHIHLEDLREDCIPLPPLAEQARIVAEVERRLSVVDELETAIAANLQRSNGLRASLLTAAFTNLSRAA
jgi:type I restriction enzyme, S subunit